MMLVQGDLGTGRNVLCYGSCGALGGLVVHVNSSTSHRTAWLMSACEAVDIYVC
jgi:hypothetical protein